MAQAHILGQGRALPSGVTLAPYGVATRLFDEDDEDDEDDEETATMLKNLDLAQAAAKRALLISYVLSPAQIEDLLFEPATPMRTFAICGRVAPCSRRFLCSRF